MALGDYSTSTTGWLSKGDSKWRCHERFEVLRKMPRTSAIFGA
jgi:hypothetical protein